MNKTDKILVSLVLSAVLLWMLRGTVAFADPNCRSGVRLEDGSYATKPCWQTLDFFVGVVVIAASVYGLYRTYKMPTTK